MNRRLIVGGILAALFGASSLASARFLYPDPPWCPTCYIEAQVDFPAEASYTRTNVVPYGAWYIAGWAFVCHNGQLPTRFDVIYRKDDGNVQTLFDVVAVDRLRRPDVQRWFQRYRPTCAAPANAGFHLYMPTPIPKGTREVYVNIWNGGLLHGQYRVVTIR